MTTDERIRQLTELLAGHPHAETIISMFQELADDRDNLRSAVDDALEQARKLAYDLGNA